MPITTAAYEIIYNNKSPGDVYGMLMHREQKFESE
jgi:glycerol-3-phosphate dehydrogenase